MTRSFYEDVDVTTVINAAGSSTTLGGSRMAPEVIQEMDRAAQSFVRMDELMKWAGRQIVSITGAEAGIVTTGASGAIVLAAAACLTGQDRTLMEQLPDTEGVANEFVMERPQRISFDRGLRTVGGQIVEVGDRTETNIGQLEGAIGRQTAAVFHVVLDPQPTVPLSKVVDIAHRHDVPVIVDAAAELPPAENLSAFLDEGADLVLFSGGKDIRGPNDTGLLLGREDLVSAAAMQCFPRNGIGRPLKVSKEQIVGLVVALRRWAALDHEARHERWHGIAERVCESMQDVAGVRASVTKPDRGPRPLWIPRARMIVEEAVVGMNVNDIEQRLRDGTPSVEVWADGSSDTVWINPQHLRDDEVTTVVTRLRSVINERS